MEDFTYFEKPTGKQQYCKNLQLKNKTCKIVNQLGGKFSQEKWASWNFKKNTGYKPIFSCKGYGGDCGCGKNRGKEIKNSTQFIQTQAQSGLREWKFTSEQN
ncbi:hypothetical protein TTHERM_00726100 (macronuclear) [Tetrahymena thermophila SB210]|uniref:Uncharacterized protein n=1 Tax=Tetrahymena thermophila (strain SB210) TaxID=312017 RepID=Q24GI0_TETTS|nr:hypothetical protein TTHERM_00726100 [Tetrahymena thermophila SB210]EAS06891.1 hypothetical protein TTHERM_00726100 [Tetrahymena thermophila SB210]|eukprot:XP_001027133.1 hypothetical protein TTHERM_00726100 [Tetrahymena thermophila SB210]